MPVVLLGRRAHSTSLMSFADYQASVLAERRGYALYGAVTGGYGASSPTIVTNTNDSGAGSLRAALTGGNNRWVVFDRSVFPLASENTIALTGGTIDMRDITNVTLDGYGAKVKITGYGITTAVWTGAGPTWATNISNNLILNNVKINTITAGNFDCLTIDGTDRAWFHHLECSDGGDGNVDITLTGQGPNANGYMTLSNCRIFDTQSSKNCLFGDQTELAAVSPSTGYGDVASATSSYPSFEGGDNRITSVDNWFHDIQRNPIEFNYWMHHYNSYFNGWTLEGPAVMGGGAQQYLEGCVMDGTGGGVNASKGEFAWTYGYTDTSRKYKRMGEGAGARANVYLGGATFNDGSGGFLNPAGTPFWSSIPYSYAVQDITGDSGAALIARLSSATETNLTRAGRIQRPGYFQLCVG